MTGLKLHKDWIDPTAYKIVQVLQNSGYETYLVGGCVRDLLVGIAPKDFDIATNALPEQVRKKIPNSFIIGKRFRLVLVKKGTAQFEVATFRRNKGPDDPDDEDSGPLIRDNFFGTCEDDARRRDFTVNAVFYDPIKDNLVDFCGGLADIESRTLQIIGNPEDRLIEDPIRILRAIRLSHKIGFQISPELRAAIPKTASHLKNSVLPRRREEYLKVLKLNDPDRTFFEMHDLGVLEYALPSLHSLLSKPETADIFSFYMQFFKSLPRSKMEPIELFTYFLFVIAKTISLDEEIDIAKIVEDPRFFQFMKDELGMFKLEMSDFFRALQFIPLLNQVEIYQRKGSRRKTAFLNNDCFHISLHLSYTERRISSSIYYFWLQEIEKNLLQPALTDQENPENN